MPTKKIDELIEKKLELTLLYDFYGALMKDKHQEIFEDYVLNDLSLGEISEDKKITRQGVFDVVKRCSEKLFQYEEKLQLASKFHDIKDRISKIENEMNEIKQNTDDSLLKKQIKKWTDHLKEILDII